ncbi:hypothetical protein PRVXT_002074 [Proteinivorax tanatarense]|uniref:Uncharacterized protein n=1 Tax=Proteinivorax tanatarense TaxID=1260629 RepID=A0AAU7VJ40_9FIRM
MDILISVAIFLALGIVVLGIMKKLFKLVIFAAVAAVVLLTLGIL